MLKQQIISQLLITIEDKISVFSHAIESALESRNNETKSSAGDKYETSREMIQIEIDKNSTQLENARKQKSELIQIPLNKIYTKGDLGSIIETNKGTYFLSIGIGKIIVQNQIIYTVSPDSPIGKLLQNKTVGSSCMFQENEFVITNIL